MLHDYQESQHECQFTSDLLMLDTVLLCVCVSELPNNHAEANDSTCSQHAVSMQLTLHNAVTADSNLPISFQSHAGLQIASSSSELTVQRESQRASLAPYMPSTCGTAAFR